jgi:hypothetical protein
VPYEKQANTLDTKPSGRTLQRYATQDGAKRFKKPYTSEIFKKIKLIRVEKHEKETLAGQYTWFMDEVYSISQATKTKLNMSFAIPGKRGTLKRQKPRLDVTIYCAAGISYNRKGGLIFYKGPKEPSPETYKPRKPRKTLYQSDEQYKMDVEA